MDQHVFPYVTGHLTGNDLRGGAIEYPVLTGLFMWATAWLASSYNSYLVVSAIFLAPFALLAAWLLARMAGTRALLFAAAPALVLYAFHNWDLLAVAMGVAGFYAWWRGRPLVAAALLGLGAGLKLYPGLWLAPLALELWVAGNKRAAAGALGAGIGTFVAVNAPFALVDFSGWFATYRYHELRSADFNSVWYWLNNFTGHPGISAGALNPLTGALTATGFAAALGYGLIVARRTGRYPFVQVSAAMLAVFLAFSKVHSPQYALWLLPLFVLLRVNLLWWALYALADLALYSGIFEWFYQVGFTGASLTEATGWRDLLITGVFAREALLLVLFVLFLRARSAFVERSAPQFMSQAATRLRPIRS